MDNWTDQLDLIDIYRTFHPKTINFTFFSSAHWTFFRIGHILGHKSSLGKFNKTEITSSIFSDHNVVILEINYRENTIKYTNIWRLNNTLLNNQQITEDQKRNQYMHRNKWKCKHNNPKPMGFSKSSAKEKFHSNTGLPQETREKSSK